MYFIIALLHYPLILVRWSLSKSRTIFPINTLCSYCVVLSISGIMFRKYIIFPHCVNYERNFWVEVGEVFKSNTSWIKTCMSWKTQWVIKTRQTFAGFECWELSEGPHVRWEMFLILKRRNNKKCNDLHWWLKLFLLKSNVKVVFFNWSFESLYYTNLFAIHARLFMMKSNA